MQTMSPNYRILCLAAWLAAVCICGNAADGSEQTPAETKAEYLCKLTRYVKWPEDSFADAGASIQIGVLGDPATAGLLRRVAPERICNRPLVITWIETLAARERCHVLFITAASSPELHCRAIEATETSPVLLVGETTGFADSGAPVNFHTNEDNHVELEINLTAVRRRGLGVHPKVLRIARIIHPAKREAATND